MAVALGVIPARFASTRFPGKPLVALGDRTLIEHVWRRTSAATRLDRVIVATDDERIAEAATGFGAEVRMTSPDHPSGTDRVAEVVRTLDDDVFDVVVNVQGDEPLVSASSLDRLVAAFDDDPAPDMATLSEPIETIEQVLDPNVVKLVTDARGRALYFSRAPIPYHRARASAVADLPDALATRPGGLSGYRMHQGVYAYRTPTLLQLTDLPPSPLEEDERLEQLRALEAGIGIVVVESDFRSCGVDTPADLERVSQLLGDPS